MIFRMCIFSRPADESDSAFQTDLVFREYLVCPRSRAEARCDKAIIINGLMRHSWWVRVGWSRVHRTQVCFP